MNDVIIGYVIKCTRTSNGMYVNRAWVDGDDPSVYDKPFFLSSPFDAKLWATKTEAEFYFEKMVMDERAYEIRPVIDQFNA